MKTRTNNREWPGHLNIFFLLLLPILLCVPIDAAADTPASMYRQHTFHGCGDRDHGTAVTRDDKGNILIVGNSRASWSGPGNTLPLHQHSGGYDIFILKLDPDGNYIWHTFYGSALEDHANGIAVDGSGNILVAGESNRSWTPAPGIAPLHPHAGGSSYDLLVMKLSPDGSFLWHTFYGSSDDDDSSALAMESTGNIIVTGTSTFSWDGDGSTPPLHAHSDMNDILVLKLSAEGSYLWHTFYGVNNGQADQDSANSLTIDDSDNIYIAGDSEGSWLGDNSADPLHSHSGGYDIMVLKLAADGGYQWHTFYGSSSAYCDGNSITAGPAGSLYLTGDSDAFWAGDEETVPLHAHSGGYDIVLLKLANDGSYLWHGFYGSINWEFGNSIALSGPTTLIVAGSGKGSWLGSDGAEPDHPYAGGYDIVLLSLNTDGDYREHGFYGSPLHDHGDALVTTSNGLFQVTGSSPADWIDFSPILPHNGGDDILLASFSLSCPDDPDKGTPGMCGCGIPDTDSDGDNTPDCLDACVDDPFKTEAGICGCGMPDSDYDGDGTMNCLDLCPSDSEKTEPGVCGCGVPDNDTNNDGNPDCIDYCPNDPEKTAPEICGCGVPDIDSDGDGTPDCIDSCPTDSGKTVPGTCGCNVVDRDSDNDGTLDCLDYCPEDPGKTFPGVCGCSISDQDSDGDGSADCIDYCLHDPEKLEPGVCGCGISEDDTDQDGVLDCNDGCPEDPNKTEPGVCGCSVSETDSDGDGTMDCVDDCPYDYGKTTPGVCGCSIADLDSDGDGTADCIDLCPDDPAKTEPGACGCGTSEDDTDQDGVLDCNDDCPDDAEKTEPGSCGCGQTDIDSDGDGIADCIDGCPQVTGEQCPGEPPPDEQGVRLQSTFPWNLYLPTLLRSAGKAAEGAEWRYSSKE